MTDEVPGTKLSVSMPPGLSEALGYRGDARFVGFHFTPTGDEMAYTDGVASGSGAT